MNLITLYFNQAAPGRAAAGRTNHTGIMMATAGAADARVGAGVAASLRPRLGPAALGPRFAKTVLGSQPSRREGR